MQYSELPIAFMNVELSNPRGDLYQRLEKEKIIDYVLKEFSGPEDRADAFDGAFSGLHICDHLKSGCDRGLAHIEFAGWFEYHKSLKGPFYSTMNKTFKSFEYGELMQECIDVLIDCKGQLDLIPKPKHPQRI